MSSKTKFEEIVVLATVEGSEGGLVTDIRLLQAPGGAYFVDIRKKRVLGGGNSVYTPKGITLPLDNLRVVKQAIDNAVEALDILEVK